MQLRPWGSLLEVSGSTGLAVLCLAYCVGYLTGRLLEIRLSMINALDHIGDGGRDLTRFSTSLKAVFSHRVS